MLLASCGEKGPEKPDNEDQTEQGGNNGQGGSEEGGDEDPGNTEPTTPPKPVFQDVTLQSAFTEDFSELESVSLDMSVKGDDDFRYFPAYPSLTEKSTKILMMRLDPKDASGRENGSALSTKEHSFYGSYSARLRLPDTQKAQANLGASAVFAVSDVDETHGTSQIEMEVKLADPSIIYLRATTGLAPMVNTIERVVNLAQGKILRTKYKSITTTATGGATVNGEGDLKDEQGNPASIAAISAFSAAAAFHTYGFDWAEDSITWWIIDGKTKKKTVLWEYKGKELFSDTVAEDGVPALPSRMGFYFHHDKKNPVEGKSSATQAPKHPFELELDWIKYEPDEELIKAWHDEYFEN